MTDVPSGFLPPPGAYQPPAPLGLDSDDPLVNPQFAGINGWFTRLGSVFRRSGKSMAAIFAITYLVPNIVITVLGAGANYLFLSRVMPTLPNQTRRYEPDPQFLDKWGLPLLALLVAGVLVVVVLYIVELAGYAAATYAVTREATGQRVGLGEALGYGFRRSLGLFGWLFLGGLLTVIGFVFCILPGLYMIAALALVGPIYLFERRNAIGRSFSIFNKNLGRVLGRLALLLCAMIAAGVLSGIIGAIGSAVAGTFGTQTLSLNATVAASTVSSVLGVIIQLPLTMVIFSGILLTYTEQRGFEGPVNAATLAAEL